MGDDKKGRAYWHDYKAKCIYFITMKKSPSKPSFGRIIGDPTIPNGSPGCAAISLSPLGKIVRNAIYNISRIEPKIRLFQYALMPDHVHFLISVEEQLDESVGLTIARLKAVINHATGETGIFQEGYNDQILRLDRNLNSIFNYIRDNPRRLAMRMANPDYFSRVARTDIAGHPCMLYGNLDLLRNPFKQQVIVHRADTDTQFRRNMNECIYTAGNGGVLVSPFISPREHEIFDAAEAADGRFIKLSPTPLGDRAKPTGRDFRLCSAGRLLIIFPLDLPDVDTLDNHRRVTRTQALLMNSLSSAICKELP